MALRGENPPPARHEGRATSLQSSIAESGSVPGLSESNAYNVLPWTNGRCMVWDFTCPDTLAASRLDRAVFSASAVASDAETRKSSKYLGVNVLFRVRIAVETLGRGTRRRGVRLLLRPWPPHRCSNFET